VSPTEARHRIALVLEYHGAGFSGSQRQRNGPSIQQELETAVERIFEAPARVAFAGRTDAGVHATAQVAAFTTRKARGPQVIIRALNAVLPQTIAVRNALEVPLAFDPRRDASSRTYRYTIYNAPERSPLWLDRSWHVPKRLDDARMAEAAAILVGEHDFAAFSRREPTTTVRRVLACQVERCGERVSIAMTANAFLRQQVRRTAGALVEVGLGKQTTASFKRLLARAEPHSAGPVAPACGLVLTAVDYPKLDLMAGLRYD
jgi:tRNA pseudouridine38-40 synthase